MPDQRAPDIDPAARAALADLDARRARLRADIASSPLGRYTAGREAAHTVDAAVAREQDAVRWAVRVGAMLRALADGDDNRVREELAGLPVDDVAELQTAGETLADLCSKVAAGRRS